jgi:hypothetical protein
MRGEGHKKRKEMTSVVEDLEKLKRLCVVGGNVKWCRYHGKRYGSASKTGSPHDPGIPLLIWIQKNGQQRS